MTSRQQDIQEQLNASAEIVRKYNVGDRSYFFMKFINCDKTQLETAWSYGLKKIQSREIIKDSHGISEKEVQQVNERLKTFDDNAQTLFTYLNSEFDVKKLKLADENAERRLRQLMSYRYIDLISKEVSELSIKEQSTPKSKTKTFFAKYKAAFIILAIVGAFASPRIIDGLTPVDTLTIRLHENSKYKYRVGATCSDGWHSNATGRGACSHHGGVSEWLYGYSYHKTMDECKTEAKSLSWRN